MRGNRETEREEKEARETGKTREARDTGETGEAGRSYWDISLTDRILNFFFCCLEGWILKTKLFTHAVKVHICWVCWSQILGPALLSNFISCPPLSGPVGYFLLSPWDRARTETPFFTASLTSPDVRGVSQVLTLSRWHPPSYLPNKSLHGLVPKFQKEKCLPNISQLSSWIYLTRHPCWGGTFLTCDSCPGFDRAFDRTWIGRLTDKKQK